MFSEFRGSYRIYWACELFFLVLSTSWILVIWSTGHSKIIFPSPLACLLNFASDFQMIWETLRFNLKYEMKRVTIPMIIILIIFILSWWPSVGWWWMAEGTCDGNGTSEADFHHSKLHLPTCFFLIIFCRLHYRKKKTFGSTFFYQDLFHILFASFIKKLALMIVLLASVTYIRFFCETLGHVVNLWLNLVSAFISAAGFGKL